MIEVYVMIAYKEWYEGVDQVIRKLRTEIYPSNGDIKKYAVESKADYVRIETRLYIDREDI